MKYNLTGVILLCLFLASCGQSAREQQLEALRAERDSLIVVTQQQDSVKAVFDTYVETIAMSLDSIRTQEQILTLNVDENGRRLRKSEIKSNLELLGEVIKRQRERIEEMEALLLQRGVDSTSYYRTLISHLYEEIDAKKMQVEALQRELSRKNAEVSRLNKRVDMLEEDVASISEQAEEQASLIERQTEIMEAQDQMLNVGYVKIGTKKELQNAGIIKSNIFSGGKLNPAGVDKSLLDEVDIRHMDEVTLMSKKPKLLTSHPASSYRIDYAPDMSVLVILDHNAFWSASNFLIIQL